jgi:hypothetical protein
MKWTVPRTTMPVALLLRRVPAIPLVSKVRISFGISGLLLLDMCRGMHCAIVRHSCLRCSVLCLWLWFSFCRHVQLAAIVSQRALSSWLSFALLLPSSWLGLRLQPYLPCRLGVCRVGAISPLVPSSLSLPHPSLSLPLSSPSPSSAPSLACESDRPFAMVTGLFSRE